jgi:hypothetical protein
MLLPQGQLLKLKLILPPEIEALNVITCVAPAADSPCHWILFHTASSPDVVVEVELSDESPVLAAAG